MASTEQWRCTFCETWNLDSSETCLVCERVRTDDALSAGPAVTDPYASARRPPPPPPPPPPSSGPGATAPVTEAITPSVRNPVAVPSTVEAPWWMIPAIIFAIGALVIAVVLVVLTLTG